MRKLVTIRHIKEILPIEGADMIELAKVDDWQVVIKKGEFYPGSYCVYFEIDSFLPTGNPAWQFLVDKQPRTFEGVVGHRLRTVKLRGQVSQGFIAKIDLFPQIIDFVMSRTLDGHFCEDDYAEFRSEDFANMLGVKKYEPPIPAELAGNVVGNFPSFIQKTDQERCQNLGDEIFVENEDSRYEITMKLDGTSFTAFYKNEQQGVCGRNWELKADESNNTNTLVRMYIDSGMRDVLHKYGKNIALQGELMGPGIQKNRENLAKHKLFVFDIYDIDNSCYFPPHVRHEILQELWNLGLNKDLVDHVPVVAMAESLEDLNIFGISGLLEFTEGPSINHLIREGLVFKRVDGKFSFKAISNKFLLKEED